MKQAFPSITRIIGACGAVLFLSMWLLVGSITGQAADLSLHHALLFGSDAPRLLNLLRFVTTLGGFAFLSILGLSSFALLLALRRTDTAILLLAILAGGRLLALVIKMLIARARPELGDHLVAVHSLSFPSEHAFNSIVTYGLLALLSGSRAAYLAAFVLTLLIGVSRILLGVHWPTDVVAGWSLGMAWLSLCWGLRSSGLHHRAADK